MTRDIASPLPPADKKVGDLPLGTRFFDLEERHVYFGVATLLLFGAIATIGLALYTAIVQTSSGMGLLIPIFSLLNDLLLVLIITEVLRTVVGFIGKRAPGVKVVDLTPFLGISLNKRHNKLIDLLRQIESMTLAGRVANGARPARRFK